MKLMRRECAAVGRLAGVEARMRAGEAGMREAGRTGGNH